MDSDEVRYIAASLRRMDETADILAKALAYLESKDALDSIIRELAEELSQSLDRFEEDIAQLNDGIIALTSQNQTVTNELHSRAIDNAIRRLSTRIQQIEHLISDWSGNLFIWEQEDAKHGGSPPIHITTSIIEAKERLQNLTKERAKRLDELEYYRKLKRND